MGDKISDTPSKSKSDEGSGSLNASNGASPPKSSPLPRGSNSSPSKPKPPPAPLSNKGDDSTSPNRIKQSQALGPKLAPSTGKPSQSSSPISQRPLKPPSSSPPSSFNGSPPSGFRTSEKPSPPYRKNSPPPKKGLGARTEYLRAKSNSKLTGPSNTSSNPTSEGGFESTGKYVGYALAGVFFVALVAVVLVFALKRKRGRTEYTVYIPPDRFPMKPDGHHYGRYPGIVKGFYGQQPFNSSLGKKYGKASHRGAMQQVGTPETRLKFPQKVFSFRNIIKITNGFSRENVIGEGGFGYVYKGWLRDGRVVAVKQLKAGSGQGEREFSAEVEIISRVHHRHLVSLVGYCMSRQQRVLIYEFVPNKTLYHHLHGSGMPVLAWFKRVKIAIGAAKGLAYLHEDCYPKIIHRDIKSSNILLDDSFEAQVADFGLAKLHDGAHSHITTRVMGTFGYVAPEYATSGKLTDRSDVFSFGVVLLELITGRKPVDRTRPLGDESLVEWARPLLIRAVETGDCSELVDPRLEKNFVESEMRRMVEAAAACIRHSAPRRPSMVQVVRALLDNGDDLCDLSNGVKYGHSVVYDSGQYNEDIRKFRRMNNSRCGSFEYDTYSEECNSAELCQYAHCLGSSYESETQAFNKHRCSIDHSGKGEDARRSEHYTA